ncbi:hypothetical protein SAMN04488011_105135 [Palleronia pelagia]|uniref:Uncharacterized protein n=2 Tax=Palleronia pelagia TaxID=387096 RepID=A0A1H8I6S9_9RHOB|nr:hypothetical protein SAMN04488011_105135 [Palleronia pelagia]
MTDTSRSMTFTIEGEVPVQITIHEDGTGGLVFTLLVDESGGTIGDLNGLFFDFGDPALVDGLLADGAEVTNTDFEYDGVDNLGGGVNIKGDLVNDTDLFDAGVRLGTSGMAKDDLQTATFTLTHETEDLTLEDVALMDFAVRLTSTGEIDGSRDGSLKLGGTSPEAPADDSGVGDGGGDYGGDDTLPDDPDTFPDFPDDGGDLGAGDEFLYDDGGVLDAGDPLLDGPGDDGLLQPPSDDPLLSDPALSDPPLDDGGTYFEDISIL